MFTSRSEVLASCMLSVQDIFELRVFCPASFLFLLIGELLAFPVLDGGVACAMINAADCLSDFLCSSLLTAFSA